jgi:hypothetical protein
MVSRYGDKNAGQPANGYESKSPDSPITGEADNVKRLLGSSEVTFKEMIDMHLLDCNQCRHAIMSPPVAIGQKSRHCNAYWHLQLMQAKYEGAANNIVAYTEFGDEARKGGNLE